MAYFTSGSCTFAKYTKCAWFGNQISVICCELSGRGVLPSETFASSPGALPLNPAGGLLCPLPPNPGYTASRPTDFLAHGGARTSHVASGGRGPRYEKVLMCFSSNFPGKLCFCSPWTYIVERWLPMPAVLVSLSRVQLDVFHRLVGCWSVARRHRYPTRWTTHLLCFAVVAISLLL